jgi:hypothetical protein
MRAADGGDLLARLNRASERQRRPQPEGAPDGPTPRRAACWWSPPELISLAGTAAWEGMDEAARRRLSFWETVAFFSLNVHNERRLVTGVLERRGRIEDPEVGAYLDHFAREEQEHTALFEAFCTRHAGGTFPDRALAFPEAAGRLDPDAGDLLFFGRVLLFEDLVDRFNVACALDARLPEAVRDVHRRHHRDEARHLLFGKEMLRRLWSAHHPRLSEATRAALAGQLRGFLLAAWRDLFSVDAYRAVGLERPLEVRRAALASPAAADRFRWATTRCLGFFAELGLPCGPTSPEGAS